MSKLFSKQSRNGCVFFGVLDVQSSFTLQGFNDNVRELLNLAGLKSYLSSMIAMRQKLLTYFTENDFLANENDNKVLKLKKEEIVLFGKSHASFRHVHSLEYLLVFSGFCMLIARTGKIEEEVKFLNCLHRIVKNIFAVEKCARLSKVRDFRFEDLKNSQVFYSKSKDNFFLSVTTHRDVRYMPTFKNLKRTGWKSVSDHTSTSRMTGLAYSSYLAYVDSINMTYKTSMYYRTACEDSTYMVMLISSYKQTPHIMKYFPDLKFLSDLDEGSYYKLHDKIENSIDSRSARFLALCVHLSNVLLGKDTKRKGKFPGYSGKSAGWVESLENATCCAILLLFCKGEMIMILLNKNDFIVSDEQKFVLNVYKLPVHWIIHDYTFQKTEDGLLTDAKLCLNYGGCKIYVDLEECMPGLLQFFDDFCGHKSLA